MRRSKRCVLALLLLLTAARVHAQTKAPPALGPIPDDPLLAPVPPAPRELQSWEEVLRLARQRSPLYQLQRAAIARARAQVRLALAAVLPSLRGDGTYVHEFLTEDVAFGPDQTITTPVPNVLGVSATATWPVGDARSYYAIGSAKMNVAATEQDFAEQRRELAAALVEALLGTEVARYVCEVQRHGLRAALEREHLTRAKHHYGQGTELDIDRALEDVESARNEVVLGDESLRRAREALAMALGSNTPMAASRALEMSGFQRALVQTCRLHPSVEQRADIAAARTRVELARRATSDVWLSFLPSLSLASRFGFNSQVSYGPKTTWEIQASLSVPFYDGGARYARLADARGAEEQASAQLNQTRVQALLEVTQAQRASQVAAQTLTIAERARDLARRVDQNTRLAYRDGLGTSFELVNTAQALRQAELSALQARFELMRTRALAALANADCEY